VDPAKGKEQVLQSRAWTGGKMSVAMPQRLAASAVKIADADTNWAELHDLWVTQAPAPLHEPVPQVKLLGGRRFPE